MSYLTLRDGRKLFYEKTGCGNPVIFLHGWKSSSDVFQVTTESLSSKYCCIRYDHCGHVRSDVPDQMPVMETLADDLSEIIMQMKLPSPVLVGWSMGGATILEFLRKYGCSNIGKIVLVDITPRMFNDESWKNGRMQGKYTKSDLSAELLAMKNDFCSYMVNYYKSIRPDFAEISMEEGLKYAKSRLVGQNSSVLISLWNSLAQSDWRDVLENITVPTAVFHAGVLPICMPSTAKYYREHIKGPVKIVEFTGATHGLISECPEKCVDELDKFLSEK